jgi:ferrochelatase
LLDVRGYRPTPPEIIHEVRERYRLIGGRSPILERTREQAAALEAALNAERPGVRAVVGMRHWHPFIREALGQMAEAGIRRAVGLVMAPHYSRLSIGAYFQRVAEAGAPVAVAPIERWHLLPGYIEALAGRVQAALERFPAGAREQAAVVFTAHSLPRRILEWNDPYPDELRETTRAVIGRLADAANDPGLAARCSFAYQSAALTGDPWLGPDVSEELARLAAEGRRQVVVAPIGFVCEHVEILYDLDILLRRQAQGLGVQLERIDMLNTAPPMIAGLAALARERAREAGWC